MQFTPSYVLAWKLGSLKLVPRPPPSFLVFAVQNSREAWYLVLTVPQVTDGWTALQVMDGWAAPQVTNGWAAPQVTDGWAAPGNVARNHGPTEF